MYRFKRNANGKLDGNSKYQNKNPKYVGVKYDCRIRLMLGVAATKYPDSRVEGKHLDLYNYKYKTAIPDKDMQAKVDKAINKVKFIKSDVNGQKGGWTESSSGLDEVFENNGVNLIKGILETKEKILATKGLT